MWFGDMATCIYTHFVIEADVCGMLGYCSKDSVFTPRDWTCEECVDIMARVGAYIGAQETIDAAVEYLQGDCFCGQEGHSEDCADTISGIVPLTLPVLSEIFVDRTDEHCTEIIPAC